MTKRQALAVRFSQLCFLAAGSLLDAQFASYQSTVRVARYSVQKNTGEVTVLRPGAELRATVSVQCDSSRVADNDLVPLTFNLGGVAGTQTLFTAVQQ
jgi:hypothetical protein